MRLHLPFGIRQKVYDNSKYISKEEYRELSQYAANNGIRLEGFKQFKGDIEIIKELLDDIITISKDFPMIIIGRKPVTISLYQQSSEDDFATTINHIVYLNAKLYDASDYLKSEYESAMEQNKFVYGTDYRSVIRHEIGHVVANIYKIDPFEIARKVLPNMNKTQIKEYIRDNLSIYASEYDDGREFISESFSAYYSKVNNDFAEKYVEECKNYIKGGN